MGRKGSPPTSKEARTVYYINCMFVYLIAMKPILKRDGSAGCDKPQREGDGPAEPARV